MSNILDSTTTVTGPVLGLADGVAVGTGRVGDKVGPGEGLWVGGGVVGDTDGEVVGLKSMGRGTVQMFERYTMWTILIGKNKYSSF